MLDGNEDEAQRVAARLKEQRLYLQQEGEEEAAEFLAVLNALLQHVVPKAMEGLQGPYAQALNRLLNQVSVFWKGALNPPNLPASQVYSSLVQFYSLSYSL